MSKVALVTGVTGQDGAYLAEFLLNKGYTVHGVKRRASSFNTARIDRFFEEVYKPQARFILHYGDMTDSSNLLRLLQEVEPDELYNLAAQSHVRVSFDSPEYTANTDALGVLRLLEAIRIVGLFDKTRFYQASSSEMFGLVQETPQTESTPFYPRSPYGVAKLYGYWITVNYREAYGLFGCNGILFNHESPVRGETFVTRKVTRSVARIAVGLDEKLCLGNLDAKRDWGHAADYVKAMWLMLQQEQPDDYVVATGKATEIREFVRMAFSRVGLTLAFRGSGLEETAVLDAVDAEVFQASVGQPPGHLECGQTLLEIDPRYFRPAEVDLLLGDATKAQRELGWQPTIALEEMVGEMVRQDLREALESKLLSDHGHRQLPPLES